MPGVLFAIINLYAVKIEENQLIIKLTAFVHECKKEEFLGILLNMVEVSCFALRQPLIYQTFQTLFQF